MRKIICFLAVICITVFCISGCSTDKKSDSDISVVTTVFPVYDWVREISGGAENVSVNMLLDSGADMHSYQPTADDIIKISGCDMFIYIGGSSDVWIEDILKQVSDDTIVINLIEVLGDAVIDSYHDHEHEDGKEHEHLIDEHIWLSLKNAKTICGYLADRLADFDTANADSYTANVKSYSDKLTELDSKYKSAVESAKVKTLVFGDRFPFGYLAHDYSLEHYAAFSGCSAESDASFETIIELAGRMDMYGLSYIFTTEGSDQKIAQTVIDATADKNAKILVLDSMQTTVPEEDNSYLSVMESNLEILKKAFEG